MIGETVVEGLRSGIDPDCATEITLDLIHIPLSLDVGAMDHHDHTTEEQAEIITEDTEEMHLSQLLIYHDTPMYETVPPRARRLAGVEEMVAVQRTLQGEVTATRRVQEELLKVEGKRLALEKEKLALEKEKLALEKEKLAVKKEKLAMEKETFAMEKYRRLEDLSFE
eukprot:XP_014033762.1 PREDICTED: myb/SANT-like DNA-binding domain-containing protein 4 [Salmo salar]